MSTKMDEFLRRTSDHLDANDKTESRILELIEATQDSKDKALLLILLRLNTNIFHNTNIVTSVAGKLDKHLTVFEIHAEEELKRINQGAGVKKVLSYVSGFIQTALLGVILYFQGALVEVKDQIAQQQISITRNTTIIQNHDKVLEQIKK